MFPKIFHDLSKTKLMQLLESVKRSEGKAVAELAEELEMSYMGVKQHCIKLEKMGYVKTRRVPRKEAGRPEKLYCLTEKCEALFPQAGVELTLNVLESVRDLYGEAAPEKLLYHHFQQLGEEWSKSVAKGKSLVERATRLVELRQKEGYFCHCHYDPDSGFVIEEYHHPMEKLFKKYPSAATLEIKVMEKLIGSTVVKELRKSGKGGVVTAYTIATL